MLGILVLAGMATLGLRATHESLGAARPAVRELHVSPVKELQAERPGGALVDTGIGLADQAERI